MIVGVDPGGATTGIVKRDGTKLLAATLVTNDGDFDAYLADVEAALEPLTVVGHLAVEDLTHPNPHLGLANVTGLLGTAQVLGLVRHLAAGWVEAGDLEGWVLVPPAGHGSAPLRSYPAPLVGERETKGTGRLRHARSAWDIAGAGAVMLGTRRLVP
mgnify:CR=1 FL=1